MKKVSKNWLKLIFVYNFVCILLTLFFYRLVPQLLCYPPNSIDNEFQIAINGLTYTQQYIMIVLCSLAIENIILLYSLKKVNKLKEILKKCDKEHITQAYYNLSKTVLQIPNKIYIIQILIPVIMIATTFSLLKGDFFITLKVCLLFSSILTLIASIAYIFSKKTFQRILVEIFYEVSDSANIDSEFTNYVKRYSIKRSILVVTLPMFIVTAVLVSLTGYSSLIKETGDLTYAFYNSEINELYIPSQTTENPTTLLYTQLQKVSLKKEADYYFIISPNGKVFTSNGSKLSDFFLKYLDEVSDTQPEKYRVYDFYGDDSQGAFRTVNINGDNYIIGIHYNLVSNTILTGLIYIISILFIANIILLFYFSNYIANEINRVSNALLDISKNKNESFSHKLAVVSNDEIGDLVNAFNQIQFLAKENLEQIKNNQNMLMERERLASLGQLIGGIAHNLKTPIMSISGAAEGLKDLVKEYDISIGDPEVNSDDHHAIASEMDEWIEKIKSYTEYMSDVITAVKGQAVTLSEEQKVSFDIDELVKRVHILMKHELKNALINLNINNNVDEKVVLHGNIVSLVQVINNMISNSIQAYEGETNKDIDLTIYKENNNIIISIRDYASGLPKKVQDKLFKSMITTKGKNGTGLGLFMSYSTIRAHFNGDITFETKNGKGTNFKICIPI